MDDGNDFLRNYNKNRDAGQQAELPAGGEKRLAYEERSAFRKPARTSRPSANPPRSRRGRWVGAAVAAVVVLGAVLAAVLIANRGAKMADLTGWTQSDAQLWANENNVTLQIAQQHDDAYGEGIVIAQSVRAGERVRKGDFIRLTVSLGHDLSVTLTLPDLLGMTKDEVTAWAEANFMTKVRITAEYSDTVALGAVIGYEINDATVVGNEVRRDTPVYVVVSRGPDPSAVQVTVPNFKEMTISESYLFANENGITLAVREAYDEYAPEGSVVSQSVPADEKITRGTEIVLTVSRGKKVTVPDFSDWTRVKASAVAGDLGISVMIAERYSSVAAGGFVSQSIAAGSVYEKGDYIELVYSLGNRIVVSSFVGQPRDAMESWAAGLNEQGASITLKATYTQSNSPAGTILYQDKSNVPVSVTATLRITVSLGRVTYVPDFVAPEGSGYDAAVTREKALALCDEAGLVAVFVAEARSGRLPGEIWSQSLAAGAETAEGSSVTLKYVPSATVTVPDIVAENLTPAAAAAKYGRMFTLAFADAEIHTEGKAGLISAQSLAAGGTAASGAALTLYVGPEPEPTAEPAEAPE